MAKCNWSALATY